jgi:hypothetical protein
MVRVGVLLSALLLSTAAHAECSDPGAPRDPSSEVDCDDDGFAPADGDCDDFDPDVNPDADEVCGDGVDNNCDGFVDEGCDEGHDLGSLQGGAGCGAGTPIPAFALLLWAVARPRRRR